MAGLVKKKMQIPLVLLIFFGRDRGRVVMNAQYSGSYKGDK